MSLFKLDLGLTKPDGVIGLTAKAIRVAPDEKSRPLFPTGTSELAGFLYRAPLRSIPLNLANGAGSYAFSTFSTDHP
jgi:hypothetical protein